MTKHQWRRIITCFRNHIDPENEEHLKTEIENKVKRIMKLSKTINHGNKVENLNKKSELIHLVEDFHQQYQSLYTLYEDLRREVKIIVNDEDDDNSSSYYYSVSDSESYYSPEITSDTSDKDDTVLKDKLTSLDEIQKAIVFDSQSKMKLEDHPENAKMKLEISTLGEEKRELEEKISKLEAKILEMEDESKEQERMNTELCSKIEYYQKTLLEQGTVINDLKNENEQAEIRLSDSKSNFELLERKLEEIVETKENYEKERRNRDQIEFNIFNNISNTANDLLTKLDSMALNFEQKSDDLFNRISKVSFELKLAKNNVKNNKATMKEKEDEIIGLKEEKKEAIKQLCVSIDYHRRRSVSYKTMLSEINARRLRRAS